MKTNEEYEREFIDSSKELTGLSIPEWMTELDKTGLKKQKELIGHIKASHGLNHMQSNWIAGIYLNDGKPVYDQKVLREKLLSQTNVGDLYLDLENLVKAELPDTQIVACKGYMSFRSKKEYGCARINKNDLRIGMDLGDEPHTERLVKAKGLGAMPRLAHMVVVGTAGELDAEVTSALKRAYDRFS